jgi:hypothetical protein
MNRTGKCKIAVYGLPQEAYSRLQMFYGLPQEAYSRL